MKNEIKIRLQERIRIYRDSPNVNATYVDLAQLLEDILEIHQQNGNLGFLKEKK